MNYEELRERLELSVERICSIREEHFGCAAFEEYFAAVAEFVLLIEDTRVFLEEGGLEKADISEIKERNLALYQDILEDHYEESYANPAYASARLGGEFGALLAFLYAEMRSMIGFVYEGRLMELVTRSY